MIDAYYAQGLSALESVSLPAEQKEVLRKMACGLMNRKV
jgi:DNA-binding NarL/FixJ family response regulator